MRWTRRVRCWGSQPDKQKMKVQELDRSLRNNGPYWKHQHTEGETTDDDNDELVKHVWAHINSFLTSFYSFLFISIWYLKCSAESEADGR